MEETTAAAASTYLYTVKQLSHPDPVVLIDESDVVKPDGKHFEALGIVRDGSESTQTKHPVSIFSRIHSSAEKDYKSVNTVTFDAIRQAVSLFEKATFVMDRGYDDNKNRRKGKIRTDVFYKGKKYAAYLTHVKVQITASRKPVYLVLVYGIIEHL